MRWTTKAALLFGLSRVPFGRLLYRKLQQVAQSTRLDIVNEYEMKSAFLKRMQAQGFAVAGREFLEIGTGWHPVLPVLLRLAGAARVVTIDLNPWMTRRTLAETLEGLTRVADRIGTDFAVPADHLRARLAALVEDARPPTRTVAEVLERAGIAYRMPCDAGATGLPARSVDCVVSFNVLEHVPADVIRQILRESLRILRPGGGHYHRINPGDHFAADRRVSTVHFLRFSRHAWYPIGGSGLAYHNRLRCAQYVSLFEQGGFRIACQEKKVDKRALEMIEAGTARIHRDFAGYTPEQLACEVIEVLAVLGRGPDLGRGGGSTDG